MFSFSASSPFVIKICVACKPIDLRDTWKLAGGGQVLTQ